MGTPYQTIFDGVISKLRSPGIPNITEDVLMDTLADFIRPACVKFREARTRVRQRNDAAQMFNVVLTDDEIEILTNYVLIEFISMNFLRTPTLLAKSLTSRDYHVFSSANQMRAIQNLLDDTEHRTAKLISNYSHEDSQLLPNLQVMWEQRRRRLAAAHAPPTTTPTPPTPTPEPTPPAGT